MKKCKNCKEKIAKSAKICPKCGAKLGMPGWAKALIIIAIILFCLGGCVIGCTGVFTQAVDETNNSYKDINGKTSFGLNDPFQNKDEKVTMLEVNTNFTNYSEYVPPKSGYKVIMLKFEIENVSEDNDELYASSASFNAYADGVAMESFYGADDNYNSLSSTVGKGKKAIGYIFYEVPQNAQKITVEYNPNFWTDGTNIEFVVQ